jgi:uncharacterized Ntn-hydrolase superfamily protein
LSFLYPHKAVLSTQAFANPALGPIAVQALDEGTSPADVISHLETGDAGFDYRQVSIVPTAGAPVMHTGKHCRVWAGHAVGQDFAAFGNVLCGSEVVDAIAEAFRGSTGQDLGERLLLALEAGRDAGGQSAANGAHLEERSAALIIRGGDIVEDIDLRVDSSADAVTELRPIYKQYAPYVPYYALRARDPANTPPQDVWVRKNLDGA